MKPKASKNKASDVKTVHTPRLQQLLAQFGGLQLDKERIILAQKELYQQILKEQENAK